MHNGTGEGQGGCIEITIALRVERGPRLTLRSMSPSNCFKEVIELATFHPLCFPNSYLSELQPEATEPDFY